MRWLSTVAVSVLVASGVVGCADDDSGGGLNPGGAGSTSHAGSAGSGTAGSNAAGGGAANAGSGNGGSTNAGASGSGEAGSNAAGMGGSAAGMGGAAAGMGGAAAGSAGMAGTGSVVTIPAAPTALQLAVIDGATVKLSWTDNATDETQYYVYWSTTATKPASPNLFLDASTATVNATGLTSGTQYTFWVEAHNTAGSSTALSGTATPAPVPNAPTVLVVTPSATDIKLSWTDNATDETGYRIYVATTNVKPATTTRTVAANVSTYTIAATDVTPYQTYYVWISAYNAIGESAPLSGSGAAGTAPTAPTGVNVAYDPADIFKVTATWTDNSANEGGFNVYWSTDDTKPATPGDTVAANVSTYALTKLMGGATYRFWVEAQNTVGTSAATLGTATVATTDLGWEELWLDDGASIHLAMNDKVLKFVTDADATTLWQGYHSADVTKMINPTDLVPWKIWATKTDGIDITLPHYFWAEARKTGGSLISMRSLTPSTATVANVMVTTTDTGATLTWTPFAGYTGKYQVLAGTDTLATATLGASTTTGTATVGNLLPGTDYKFWVRASGVGINTVNAANATGFPGVATMATAKTTGVNLGANLALNKVAVGSSGNATLAVDGNIATRWESAQNDGEWMYVDLGAVTTVTHTKMVWEGAYSKTLEIQVCNEACPTADPTKPAAKDWPWVTVYTGADRTLPGPFPYSELVKLNAGASGRYVRMLGKTRATAYGHSMWEFQVFNAPVAP